MSIYVQQKSCKPSLPPLSSLLRDNYKLPSIDTFYDRQQQNRIAQVPVPQVIPALVSRSPSASASPISPTYEKKKPKKQDKAFAFISHSVATFPSQEPSIDNAPLARRKRRRTSPNELNILNQEFLLGSTPNKLRRIEIAEKVSMTEKAVQIWFQNKRQSVRKQSVHDKEVTELPPTPEVSMNTSLTSIPSMANSVNNSMISANSSVISSTPVKPVLHKAQSFTSPEAIKFDSPIRASTGFRPPIASTPAKDAFISSTPAKDAPNSSFDEDSYLMETNKKQPRMFNSASSSTMTFKLGKFKVHNDKENEIPKKEKGKIQSLLNEERKVLGDVTNRENIEGVENLLSLREGNWSK